MSMDFPESVLYRPGGLVGLIVEFKNWGDSGRGAILDEGDLDFPPMPAVELCLPSPTPFGSPTYSELKSPDIAAAIAELDPSRGLFSPWAARSGSCLGAFEDMSNWY